jgi:hypothetical protein
MSVTLLLTTGQTIDCDSLITCSALLCLLEQPRVVLVRRILLNNGRALERYRSIPPSTAQLVNLDEYCEIHLPTRVVYAHIHAAYI